ncbi:MAG TPA: hypothetical protein VMW38_29655 [Terriglobia bacterium]|nr:hypothetical protein [Terriglobia bacterium]
MKRLIHQVSLAVTLSLVLGVAVVSAQNSHTLVGDIPFDFHVGKALLPAGEYTVKSTPPVSGAICIRSKDGSKSAMVQTFGLAPSKEDGVAKLVFNRYGSSYFLSQVWNPSEPIVRGLTKSKVEIEVARKASEAQAMEVALEKR